MKQFLGVPNSLPCTHSAASRDESVAVLGRIVERVVTPSVTLEDWKPEASPYGFPRAHQLANLVSIERCVS